jgi:carboxypeptidase PM20D1
MPPEHTAVGVVSGAITRLEENQMPARMTPVVREMLLRVAPEMPRLGMANLWAFRPSSFVHFLATNGSDAADNHGGNDGQRESEGKRPANCRPGAR